MTECQYLTGYSDPAKSVYSFKIDLHGRFTARDAEDAEEERLGGRKIYREEYSDAVELRRATNGRKNDAHYVSVHLSSAKLELKDEDDGFGAPPASCALTDELTKIVLAGVR